MHLTDAQREVVGCEASPDSCLWPTRPRSHVFVEFELDPVISRVFLGLLSTCVLDRTLTQVISARTACRPGQQNADKPHYVR
jgi:hypothetical protein